MINDPQLSNAPIVKQTLCRIGSHTFIFSGVWSTSTIPDDDWLCTCGCYTWRQWRGICAVSDGGVTKTEHMQE